MALKDQKNAQTPYFSLLDRIFHFTLAKLTGGLSPASLLMAYHNWLLHLAFSPGKQLKLLNKAIELQQRRILHSLCSMRGEEEECEGLIPEDVRFKDEVWQRFPYQQLYTHFLLTQEWWHEATTGVSGLCKSHEDKLAFSARQMMDMMSPSNYLLTNPEVLRTTMEERGMNLVRGYQYLMDDMIRQYIGKKSAGMDAFQIGKNIACTKGQVVYRNQLIELIQYAPTTKKVYPEPILICPAWIMKYYVLDLSPKNSLVKYLVDQGHTVFMISWKNPTEAERNLGMIDYVNLGLLKALEVVSAIVPKRRIHTVGYCIGGTLLTITAAYLSRIRDTRIKTMTLFATQADFSEAGELLLFIDESQLAFLENVMQEQGYLDKHHMKGAFNMLRSTDLVWSHVVNNYLHGTRRNPNDLMAWNEDATRMPCRMHSEYLRNFLLNNDFAEGRYKIDSRAVHTNHIRVPIFSVGTTKDHIAPWRSVYKIHLHSDTDVTFVLTNGGHNAGIVSEPGHPHREYQIKTTPKTAHYISSERWQSETPKKKGSWWPEWQKWLAKSSGRTKVNPPEVGARDYRPLCKAPGTYVQEE